MILSEAVFGFVNHKFAEGLTERSVNSYERLLNKWIEYEGDKKITEVQTSDIRKYLAWLRTEYVPQRYNGKTHKLSPGEKLTLVGNSGGGTVAIEALDLLEESGIYVDQVILRGSPVKERTLKNVGRVDYITSNADYYYSFDSNPFDGVSVQEHRVDFWGHVMRDNATRIKVADLIVSLINP
jgi:hypothetical protein